MSANDDLFDLAVRHQVGLQRYSNATVRKMMALLNRVDADIVAQMHHFDPDAVTGSWSAKRLERLLEAVRVVNRDAYNIVGKELTAELKALAAYEGVYQVNSLRSAMPVAVDIVSPSAEQLYAAVNSRPFQGRVLKEWGRDLEAGAFAKVRDAIRQGFVEGQTTEQIIRRLRGTRANQFRNGILEINRRGAEAVVRTAINHTANTARQEIYKANADLVGSWRFVATLDARTTVGCAVLDGKTFSIGEGPMPPRHYNCRSTTVPVTKSWRELGFDIDELPPGTRASMNGQVPASQTYQEWLKRQPVEVQDEVLGPTRGQLFRNGGVTLDRFEDDGRILTLDELKQADGKAFERAGLVAQ